jgi:hypothetical protein
MTSIFDDATESLVQDVKAKQFDALAAEGFPVQPGDAYDESDFGHMAVDTARESHALEHLGFEPGPAHAHADLSDAYDDSDELLTRDEVIGVLEFAHEHWDSLDEEEQAEAVSIAQKFDVLEQQEELRQQHTELYAQTVASLQHLGHDVGQFEELVQAHGGDVARALDVLQETGTPAKDIGGALDQHMHVDRAMKAGHAEQEVEAQYDALEAWAKDLDPSIHGREREFANAVVAADGDFGHALELWGQQHDAPDVMQ